MSDIQKDKIKNLTKGFYDIQKLRIATGNRVIQSFNIEKQDYLDEKQDKLIKDILNEYKIINNSYTSVNNKIDTVIYRLTNDSKSGIKLIHNKLDYELVRTYADLIKTEERMVKIIAKEVEKHPLWDIFFKDIKGCGPLMSAVCITYFDIHKAKHVSSFWKYAGLDTVEVKINHNYNKSVYSDIETEIIREGRGKKHLESIEYVDKNGNIQHRMGLTYNPELKSRLIGVIGVSFLKKPGSKYEEIYRAYRNKLETRDDANELSKLRKHNMSIRYMIKQFIRDLWVTWRELEGYEVSEPYEVACLNREPNKFNEYHYKISQQTNKKK